MSGALGILRITACMAALAACAQAQTNTLTPAEIAAGWKLLFDGKSNAGWMHPDGSKGTFALEDSALKTKGGDICTQDQYADFEFSVEYKYNAGGNSGIFLRTRKGIDPPWLNGMEVAIQDNGRANNLYKNGDAALYDVKAPSVDKWTGPGKWNKLLIRLVGNGLEHWHNGTKVIDLTLGTPEWDKLVQASKFSDKLFTDNDWGKDKVGQICLQDHGDPMYAWFRNIKVRKIDPASPVAPAAPRARGWRWTGDGVRWDAPLPAGARVELRPVDGSAGRGFVAGAGADRIAIAAAAPGVYVLRVSAGASDSRALVRIP